MPKALWEEDEEAEEADRKASKEKREAGYRAMSPRRAVVAELKNVLPGKLWQRHVYSRNAPARLNLRANKTFKDMLKYEKVRKGREAVANVLAGRRMNALRPGQPNRGSVRSMRAVSRRGIGLNRNTENIVAQMLLGPRARGQLPILERMAASRRGKNVTRRVNEARAKRIAEYERKEAELRHLGPKRERPSKTRSASAGRRSKSRSRSRSVRSA